MRLTTNIVGAEKIVCACGNTMEQHRCPSSIGYAPRLPKSQTCSFCGLKQHQNLEGSTVRLECLWRQWAQASGQLQVKSGKTIRYAVPPPTNRNVAAFGAWIASGQTDSIIVIDETRAATMDAAVPDTAANAKRAEERAKNAPPMPNQAAPVAVEDMTTVDTVPDVDDTGASFDDVATEDIMSDNAEPTEADMVTVGTVKKDEEIAW
jgi:hypothetical protein